MLKNPTDIISLWQQNREAIGVDARVKIETQEKVVDAEFQRALEGADPKQWQDECDKLYGLIKSAFKIENFKLTK